jgi:Ni/Co efflux regulator RcnB
MKTIPTKAFRPSRALALALLASASVAVVGVSSRALAQDDHRGPQSGAEEHAGWGHDQGRGHQWARGERMGYNDWNSAAPIDYRRHHLRHPPRGYEWRESNGRYVLAAVATGVIASIILSGH